MSAPAPATAQRPSSPEPTQVRRQTVVVAGDVTIDWLVDPTVDWLGGPGPTVAPGSPLPAGKPRRQNYQLHRGICMEARYGGALLLAREVDLACRTGSGEPGPRVITHRLGDPRNISPEDVLHSVVELKAFPDSGGQESQGGRQGSVFRVREFLGFSGPRDGTPPPLPIPDDDPGAEVVVLDDAGNTFRDHEEAWPLAIRTAGKPSLVIMKMSRPISGGPLFDRVRLAHLDKLILVVNADDLRGQGIDLSRSLSWERTAREFLWQMSNNPDLEHLAGLPHLVVRFALDGAIHYTGMPNRAARLYFDPALPEYGFWERHPGHMVGLTDAFIAALTARVLREGPAKLNEGIRDGIRSARRFHRLGFGTDTRRLDYPGPGNPGEKDPVFGPPTPEDAPIADVAIPPPETAESADAKRWCILELQGAGLEAVAHRLVLEGEARALPNVPVGEFGDLRTVDRTEIESYRSIRNLISQYLEGKTSKRPLCLAVFGPPGSGKSFGVEQVAKSVTGIADVKVEKLEFNLSQFESTRDLVMVLHRVRDAVLSGSVPLVFFDEFDCEFQTRLGWLRYFLAPMQDGVFKDGEGMHPIGRAIFVFAGGTSPSFAHFSREEFDPDSSEEDRRKDRKAFVDAKGPDFVSRLRGFVNVLGPNPDPTRREDRVYLIRRATILRTLLRKRWASLIDAGEHHRLNIDEGVLRALIGVPRYKHGIRSIEAVLEMSMLKDKKEFEPAALPPQDQLDQHVDGRLFIQYVLQAVLFAATREPIALAIHEKFRRDRAKDKAPDDPSMRPWADLPDTLKRANRAQAEDTLRKLELIGCGYRPRTEQSPPVFRFADEQIERLARVEHDRWMEERIADGWTWGPKRDNEQKIHPALVPWDQLEESVKQYDRDTVMGIPEFMAQAGFEVYAL